MYPGTIAPPAAGEGGWQMPPPHYPQQPQQDGMANNFSFLQYRAAAQPRTPRTAGDLQTGGAVGGVAPAPPQMQVMSRGAVPATVAQAHEVNLLIKDPEVSNKTWTVPVHENASVAEVVKMFLLRRNEDLRAACQLKISFNGFNVTDELEKTIQEFGITGRTFLQSMWTPSAGGCINPATCARCQIIVNADAANAAPRKDTIEGNPFMGEEAATTNGGASREGLKGTAERKEKERKKVHKKQNHEQFDNRLRDVVERVKAGGGREGSGSTGGAADLVLVLDRLVATVTHATDVVGQLERLYKLHSRGALTDAEYSMAKQQVLFDKHPKEDKMGNLTGRQPVSRVVPVNEMSAGGLTETERRVLLAKGTEEAHSGRFLLMNDAGEFVCRQCQSRLFRSSDRFESGCGWLSFDASVEDNVGRRADTDGIRTEIFCRECGGHLGHVFEGEGSTPKNVRHCVNSAALAFTPEPPAEEGLQRAVLGGGCFWCVEGVYLMVKGVESVKSGYCGGDAATANYKKVCSGTTDHIEVVEVTFDPKVISFGLLLEVFFDLHDPTSRDRQGVDVGKQYRSIIFAQNDEQRKTAEKYMEALDKKMPKKVVTEVVDSKVFYAAEEYHQNYFAKNPTNSFCRVAVVPKIKKIREKYADRMK